MDGSKTQIEFGTTQSYYWSFLLSSSFVVAWLLEIITVIFATIIIIMIITFYDVRLFALTIIVTLRYGLDPPSSYYIQSIIDHI